MVRPMTPAQYKAAVQRAQREQKQAVDKYNREAARHNAAVKRAVNNYNREVRAYNSAVRTHNAQVGNQRRRLNQEIRRLNARPAPSTFVTYRASVRTLAHSYEVAESAAEGRRLEGASRELIDLGSEEAANSVYLLNAMDGDGDADADPSETELRSPSLASELTAFSSDLVDRWNGALFALSPSNPDAARHFCTSAREVLVAMLDMAAPDAAVVADDDSCERTERGLPTRRAKVRYLLARKGVVDATLENLVEHDIDNVLALFHTFNKGTHGQAGRFTITQLSAIRIRVESAIGFIHTLCSS